MVSPRLSSYCLTSSDSEGCENDQLAPVFLEDVWDDSDDEHANDDTPYDYFDDEDDDAASFHTAPLDDIVEASTGSSDLAIMAKAPDQPPVLSYPPADGNGGGIPRSLKASKPDNTYEKPGLLSSATVMVPPTHAPRPRFMKEAQILDRMRVGPILKIANALGSTTNAVFLGNAASMRIDSLGAGVTGEVSVMELLPEMKRSLGIPTDSRKFAAFKRVNSNIMHRDHVTVGKGDPRCQALLRELRVLAHKPVRGEAHIIDLYTVFFESDEAKHDLAWPVAVLSYAEYGTLANIDLGPEVDFSLLGEIIVGLAKALRTLHGCLVAHRDIKPENILLVQGEKQGHFIPKLADFGHAFFGQVPTDRVRVPPFGGTRPWTAPGASGHEKEWTTLDEMMGGDVSSLAFVALCLVVAEKDEATAYDTLFWVRELGRRWLVNGESLVEEVEKRKGSSEFLLDILKLVDEHRRPGTPVLRIKALLELSLATDMGPDLRDQALQRFASINSTDEPLSFVEPIQHLPVPELELHDVRRRSTSSSSDGLLRHGTEQD
jgi:serine/threonine protein kinase